jgi:hypothetical protein
MINDLSISTHIKNYIKQKKNINPLFVQELILETYNVLIPIEEIEEEIDHAGFGFGSQESGEVD